MSVSAYSQQNVNFKSRPKKHAGSNTMSFPYITIPNNSGHKSGSLSPNKGYAVSPNLQKPVIARKDSVKNIILDAGIPVFFEKDKSTLKASKIESESDKFYSFFNSTKAITRLTNPVEELKIVESSTDENGKTHIKGQQYFKGVKIDGAEFYLHTGSQNETFTGRIYPVSHDLSTAPNIRKEVALGTVTENIRTRTTLRSLTSKEKELLKYISPETELVIYNGILAYKIVIRPNLVEEWKYYVNANDGKIIFAYNNTNSDGPVTASGIDLNGVSRSLNTYLEAGTYKLIDASETMYNSSTQEGLIMTLNANNTSTVNLNYSMITSNNNTWSIPASVSAHYNAATTFKYFKNTFGRNSINGKGGNIISLVNVTNEDGTSMDNAFWNGQAAFFGNGASAFKPLAGALDVTAHEMGHGVISNSANLEYLGQSGAINESFADIFGTMVDRDDWLIGEDITKLSFSPSGALRNMADPHNLGGSINDSYWQPKHVSEMYIGDGDNGGVHTNSGIPNYAFYLYATAVTKAKAEQVFYKALTKYLTSKSQFIDLRIAVIQSAKDLYGDGSPEVIEAQNAFTAVGIYEEVQINNALDYPVNTGQDYFLVYNTDPADGNTLYRASTNASVFNPLSTTVLKAKPSVTDDGTVAAFVSSDSKIRGIYTNPSNPSEFMVSTDPSWDNVAVSKDGNRIAAITNVIDTAIWVYDFVSDKWAKFPLYNPTTSSSGTNAGGVLYADVIEFDHTGEYLVYDSYNSLNSTTGADISYWDIGFIKVWDNVAKTFGDGTINKLYGSLPENISVGDPSFSKNSPYIMAFDYIDNNTSQYAIFGANLLTGESALITTNNTIGYPTYSKNDDKVAYTTLDNSNMEGIGVIAVTPNKIAGSGSSSLIITGAKWPVYFSEGIRSLQLAPVAYFTVDIKSGAAPLAVQYLDLSVNEPTSWSWTFPGGAPSTSNLQNPNVVYNTQGTYQVSLTCSNSAGNNSVTKTSYISVSLGSEAKELTSRLITIYPNPASDKLYVESDKDFSLKLFSLTGKLLLNVKNQKEIDLTGFQNGMYLLNIETDGKIITDKLIKQ
jgi:Zn-dependent metalloprotease/PKD repeat protein